MKKIIHNDWQDVLQGEFEQAYYAKLHEFLKHEYATQNIHPDMYHIFQAFEWTPFSKVKVVILGQDPYHGQNQAHGLSFSVQPGVQVPPSLQNIYKELQSDLGIAPVQHGYLKSGQTKECYF
ncbi:Uracil-DNA glycosylase [Pediococcus pentosaceus]|uniref:Uracil-DNA glycosylase n=1 Tax=Pediococcus pentosaceus TaxID=1255 RepID=A0A1Y0VRY9_PEDPE|nr:Uracil-DNA glycosylase [Pediococcus pentosaceus]